MVCGQAHTNYTHEKKLPKPDYASIIVRLGLQNHDKEKTLPKPDCHLSRASLYAKKSEPYRKMKMTIEASMNKYMNQPQESNSKRRRTRRRLKYVS
jgi:hypothetical protein